MCPPYMISPKLYLQAGWGAGPQPWEGHWGAGGGFEEGGATAQEEGKRPGPWLWQGWPCGAAAGEGGRRVNRLEGTGGRGGSDGDGGA